jgi:hypothetical protein
MKPHKLTLYFETQDESDLHELIRLSLAFCKLMTPEIEVEFIVERSEELDNAKVADPEPF